MRRYKFEVEARGHRIFADQPLDEGGGDEGMTPVELLASALGSCVGYYSALFCERHSIPLNDMRVDVEWKPVENPHRVGEFKVSITLPREIGEKERGGLVKYAEGCTLHNTLKHPPKIDLSLSLKG